MNTSGANLLIGKADLVSNGGMEQQLHDLGWVTVQGSGT